MRIRKLISVLLVLILAISPAALAADSIRDVFTSSGLDAPEHSDSIEKLKSEIKSAVANGAKKANPYVMPDNDIGKVMFMLTQGLLQYELTANATAEIAEVDRSYDFSLSADAGMDNDGCLALDGMIDATIYGEGGASEAQNSDKFYLRYNKDGSRIMMKLPFEEPVVADQQADTDAYKFAATNADDFTKLLDIIARNLKRHKELEWLVYALNGDMIMPGDWCITSDELIALIDDLLRELGTDDEFLSLLAGDSLWPMVLYLLDERGSNYIADKPEWQRELLLAGYLTCAADLVERSFAYSNLPIFVLSLTGNVFTITFTNYYSSDVFIAAQAELTGNGIAITFLNGPFDNNIRGRCGIALEDGILTTYADIYYDFHQFTFESALGLSSGSVELTVDEEPILSGSYSVDGLKLIGEAKYDDMLINLSCNFDPSDIELKLRAAPSNNDGTAKEITFTSAGTREYRVTRFAYNNSYDDEISMELESAPSTIRDTTEHRFAFDAQLGTFNLLIDGNAVLAFDLQSSHPLKLIMDGIYSIHTVYESIEGDYQITQALEVLERKHRNPK